LSIAVGLALAAATARAAPPVPSAAPSSVGPVANPRVIMLRLYVADIARGEKFYHEVLGTNVVQKMGDKVRIMMFPGGAIPGIILIQSPDQARMNGSFVIQVPDVQATLARAAANGGTLMNTERPEMSIRRRASAASLVPPAPNSGPLPPKVPVPKEGTGVRNPDFPSSRTSNAGPSSNLYAIVAHR
jgi:predicted enzyme related to lactoylglutathione lyase